jgi:hypothetical protein
VPEGTPEPPKTDGSVSKESPAEAVDPVTAPEVEDPGDVAQPVLTVEVEPEPDDGPPDVPVD